MGSSGAGILFFRWHQRNAREINPLFKLLLAVGLAGET